MTLKEIFEALAEGKKLRKKTWNKQHYIRREEDRVKTDLGTVYDLDFFSSYEWELWEESELKLSLEDIGKKVKLRDGSTQLLLGFDSASEAPVMLRTHRTRENGRFYNKEISHEYDIVEVVE